jgi:hypothetical protein
MMPLEGYFWLPDLLLHQVELIKRVLVSLWLYCDEAASTVIIFVLVNGLSHPIRVQVAFHPSPPSR